MKILICDDDPTNLKFLDTMLTKLGHETVPVSRSLEALQILLQPNAPKMAILDWLMPDMSGIDICRSVRNYSTLVSTYIIILTVKDKTEDIVMGLEAGANDYITKPFEKAELKARIEIGCKIISLKTEVKTLEGLLPICAWCKKMRNEENEWVKIEEVITKKTYAKLTHGSCPECSAKLRAEGGL